MLCDKMTTHIALNTPLVMVLIVLDRLILCAVRQAHGGGAPFVRPMCNSRLCHPLRRPNRVVSFRALR